MCLTCRMVAVMKGTMQNFLSFEETIIGEYFDRSAPFKILPLLKEIILLLAERLDEEFVEIRRGVFVHRTACVSPLAVIYPPTIIDKGAVVREFAYIRGEVVIGEKAVVGNSTEIKNSVVFNGAQLPHYNYVGDSIIGYKAHLGAGVICSNLRLDKREIFSVVDGVRVNTTLKKFGAIVGDFSEIGCNSVLNPGSIVGNNAVVYPLSLVKGFVPPCSVIKK